MVLPVKVLYFLFSIYNFYLAIKKQTILYRRIFVYNIKNVLTNFKLDLFWQHIFRSYVSAIFFFDLGGLGVLVIYIHPYKHIKSIKHSYSHFSILMHAFHCKFVTGIPKPIGCDQFKWIKKSELSTLPFPKANHKIFDSIPTMQP